MVTDAKRDRAIDDAWDRVLEQLPVLHELAGNLDQIRHAVAGAADLAVGELETAIAHGQLPDHWRDPCVERSAAGYTLRMSLGLRKMITYSAAVNYSMEIDLTGLPTLAGPVYDLSRITEIDPRRTITLDAAQIEAARQRPTFEDFEFRLPVSWLLLPAAERLLSAKLQLSVRILTHGPMLEAALLANRAVDAASHMAALVHAGWQLRLLPYRRVLDGAPKVQAGASMNYDGPAVREARDEQIIGALFDEHRKDPDLPFSKVILKVVARMRSAGQKRISESTVRRAATRADINASSIAARARQSSTR